MVTSTAPSFTQFHLPPALEAAIAGMGIQTPTPIQSEVIPAMLAGRDVIGQARTGSGKTLAFAVPIAMRCDAARRGVQALVLVPTRELAIQVGQVVSPLAETCRLGVTLLYGGRSLEPEKRALARGLQVVVGTPGRVLDHLRQGTLSFQHLRLFVLDEADEMLDRGMGPDVERILSQAPAQRQMALVSATIPQWVMQTAKRHLHDPVQAQVDALLDAPPEIEHMVYTLETATKFAALRTLLDQQGPDPIIVFGKTKHGVKKLASRLIDLGYSAAALQGNLSQNARERVMADFRAGNVRVLVATNVAARGLDIAGVEQIINYDMPDSAELFTHRAGRTGRMGRSGEAVTFVTPEEGTKWRQLERALGRRHKVAPWRSGGDAEPSAPPASAHPTPSPAQAKPARPSAPRSAAPAAARRHSRAAAGAESGSRRPAAPRRRMSGPRRPTPHPVAG